MSNSHPGQRKIQQICQNDLKASIIVLSILEPITSGPGRIGDVETKMVWSATWPKRGVIFLKKNVAIIGHPIDDVVLCVFIMYYVLCGHSHEDAHASMYVYSITFVAAYIYVYYICVVSFCIMHKGVQIIIQ